MVISFPVAGPPNLPTPFLGKNAPQNLLDTSERRKRTPRLQKRGGRERPLDPKTVGGAKLKITKGDSTRKTSSHPEVINFCFYLGRSG